MSHDCDKVLAKAVKADFMLSSFNAAEGDIWTCSCGRKYEHFCDEAEGCGWQEMKAEKS